MTQIMRMISTRLRDKELISLEIDRLVKDVSNIIGKRIGDDPSSLIMPLRRLGWNENILDYRTLELICSFLEDSSEPFRLSGASSPWVIK